MGFLLILCLAIIFGSVLGACVKEDVPGSAGLLFFVVLTFFISFGGWLARLF